MKYVEPVEEIYDDKESIIDFLPGFDLLNNEEVLVPAQLALSKFLHNLHLSVHFHILILMASHLVTY